MNDVAHDGHEQATPKICVCTLCEAISRGIGVKSQQHELPNEKSSCWPVEPLALICMGPCDVTSRVVHRSHRVVTHSARWAPPRPLLLLSCTFQQHAPETVRNSGQKEEDRISSRYFRSWAERGCLKEAADSQAVDQGEGEGESDRARQLAGILRLSTPARTINVYTSLRVSHLQLYKVGG